MYFNIFIFRIKNIFPLKISNLLENFSFLENDKTKIYIYIEDRDSRYIEDLKKYLIFLCKICHHNTNMMFKNLSGNISAQTSDKLLIWCTLRFKNIFFFLSPIIKFRSVTKESFIRKHIYVIIYPAMLWNIYLFT